MKYFSTLFAALFFAVSGFSQDSDPWMDDFAKAKERAGEKQCPILVAFLGPNWCPFSDKLEGEVLLESELQRLLGEKVLFVRIDIPEDFEERDFYGKDLKEAFGVDECPCMVLANSRGAAIAKLDSLPVTCQQFAAHIDQVLGDYERMIHLAKKEIKHLKVDERKHLYIRAGRLADRTFKKALMDQGLKVDRGPYFLVEQYGNLLASGTATQKKLKRIRNKVLARDPENEEGCLRRLALIDFEAMSHSRAPEEVIRPLLQYLRDFGSRDAENAWKLEMKISQYLFSKNQIEDAIRHAKLSYEKAPSEAQKEIAQSIEYLQSYVQSTTST